MIGLQQRSKRGLLLLCVGLLTVAAGCSSNPPIEPGVVWSPIVAEPGALAVVDEGVLSVQTVTGMTLGSIEGRIATAAVWSGPEVVIFVQQEDSAYTIQRLDLSSGTVDRLYWSVSEPRLIGPSSDGRLLMFQEGEDLYVTSMTSSLLYRISEEFIDAAWAIDESAVLLAQESGTSMVTVDSARGVTSRIPLVSQRSFAVTPRSRTVVLAMVQQDNRVELVQVDLLTGESSTVREWSELEPSSEDDEAVEEGLVGDDTPLDSLRVPVDLVQSPDGERLAVIERLPGELIDTRQLSVIDLERGTTQEFTGNVIGVEWIHRLHMIAAVGLGAGRRVMRIDAQELNQTIILDRVDTVSVLVE